MKARRDAAVPDPRERAARAGQRVERLRRRRAELAAGVLSSENSVDQARRYAQDAMDRAAKAHLAASRGHDEAARAHERAANHLQRAAFQGVGDPKRLQDDADEHWKAAEDNHRESAVALSEADDPTKSSSGG
jgi:hypothetical protein